ncbi:hypothetical protein BAE44_0009753 [Dichanthelium oligosanthes]|uniref:RRM domain-containing protein n=1 Tax=Dichanthelium oligosanthes TaxID=888268 RepID=A0A1E5VVS0_9POAL|nr:hypothetical protein BAE44_0009753 [Dichanthelium oligosanthes]
MSSDLGGGGGGGRRGGMERKGQAARTGAAAEILMRNSGPNVDAEAVMVEAAGEVAGVKVEGRVVVPGDAVVITDAGTDGDGSLVMVCDLSYGTEWVGMVGAEMGGDGSGENVRVPNGGGGMEGKLGVESGGHKSEEEEAAKIVEQSAYHTPQHAEAEPNKKDQFARYCLPHLDSGDIRVLDLVWGKLEDGEKSSSDEFINAVNHALEELLRGILVGMSCPCSPEELSDSGMSYLVENHGLREGVTCSTTNWAEVFKIFHPEIFLHYVKLLALFPGQGGDLLELVIACSQLTSFYQSKGCSELATFQTTSGWAENAMDAPSTKNVEEDVSSIVHSNHDKPRKGIGRPCKWKPEDGIELMEKKATSNLYNSCSYDYPGERQMAGSADELKLKGGQNRTGLHSPEVEMTDHTHDSFWSELCLHNDPIYSLKTGSTRTKPTHKRRSSLERSVPSSQQVQPATLAPKKHIQVMQRPIIHVNAKMAHEVKPTALVLVFGRPAALSSETDIIKMFRHYGPLQQTETEVRKDTNTVKVVFKKRADAERAFSVAGSYFPFGPWLQSYRLVNMPFSLGPLEASNPVTHPEANQL